MRKPFKRRNRHLPPSRALIATAGGRTEQATWVLEKGAWRCFGATGALKWMKGMTAPEFAHAELERLGISWQWIVPLFAKQPLAPPF